MPIPIRPLALGLGAVAVLAAATIVYLVARADLLDRTAGRATSDLALAADRLSGQLHRYRETAVALADHPDLTPLLHRPGAATVRAGDLLQASADRAGAVEVALVDAAGQVLASSRRDPPHVMPLAAAPHLRRAMQGALGFRHAVDPDSGQRFFLFAAPVFAPDGPVRGAVVARFAVDRVESNWRADPETVFFTDAAGVIFVANRSELIFAARAPDAPLQGPAAAQRAIYPAGLLRPFVNHSADLVQGHDLWRIDGGPYLPARALHLTKAMPIAGLTAEILVDAAPALRYARLQALAVAAGLSLAGAALFMLSSRRQVLADRLRLEGAAKAQLEARVAARTRDLSQAVERLRAEVAERQDAEAALRRAQAELVQAGKLSALGQMSAGISHELNQPLMAMRSYAENAARFLERGQADRAAQNLGQISDLARRMGRIIKNLRAFSRPEAEALSDVDLGAVVTAVLEMVDTRLRRAGVALDWVAPVPPVRVRGGEVRLQQVVLNLVSNALDAMEGSEPPKRLHLAVTRADGFIRLCVHDTGPGIAEPDRIFDPFYSTKEVGQAEGMGLGLSISYRIVESFDGRLSGVNRADGGATFHLDLRPADGQEAA